MVGRTVAGVGGIGIDGGPDGSEIFFGGQPGDGVVDMAPA
jgi:hypothetical protein